MKSLADFCTTVETGVDPNLWLPTKKREEYAWLFLSLRAYLHGGGGPQEGE